MIPTYRKAFNQSFSKEKYQDFIKELEKGFPEIPFRVAETPVFIPEDLKNKLIAAGEEIIRLIKKPDFKALTQDSIPKEWQVPGENDHPHFLTFDFGICKDEQGNLSPKLIEMQGFPSLYGFQAHLGKTYKDSFDLPSSLSPFFNGITAEEYTELLKKVILGGYEPHEVALMDVDAKNQKTAIDFFITQAFLGIPILSLTEIHKEGENLFYQAEGKKIQLKRIYNRLIFDEIAEQPELFKHGFDPREAANLEWITHPNWFYRISKYTMPFLKSEFVPETHFLNTLESIPADLENYVLKPLFSFAGMGVIIDVSPADISAISDPENWILQKKVIYEPVVKAPDGGVKAEIRLMYLWPDQGEPQLCINLARLSRGKMIGVRYNADFDWVGGTVGLMES
jgi:glutathionylspermidine synthase